MEATELRIGNYIEKSLKSGNGRKLFNRITISDINHIYEKDGSFNYEPIPLTEEILLKCGFKKTEEYYAAYEENIDVYTIGCFDIAFIDNEYKLWIGIDEDSYYSFDWTEIKYVHQLQNLYFALKCQELEINL